MVTCSRCGIMAAIVARKRREVTRINVIFAKSKKREKVEPALRLKPAPDS